MPAQEVESNFIFRDPLESMRIMKGTYEIVIVIILIIRLRSSCSSPYTVLSQASFLFIGLIMKR
jgi:hypothetical protein